MSMKGEKVAVVGSGVSGLASAWLLKFHGADVTLFESENKCGGHTLTDESSGLPVDLGFQVLRFGREAPEVLKDANAERYANITLGDYLDSKKYGQAFLDYYVAPMCAAVWSVPYRQALKFPVQMLIRFWVNHHLLDILERPLWRVLKGRGVSYVNEVLKTIPRVHTSTPVENIIVKDASGELKVEITHSKGVDVFDRVVIATHSDTALQLRGEDATPQEVEVLEAIKYSYSDVYLHSDIWNDASRNFITVFQPTCSS